jgi:hypothetical protein
MVKQVEGPAAGLGLGDADPLADQGLADDDELTTPLDLAVGAHPRHGVLGVAVRLIDAFGMAALARPVAAGRCLLAERLVRPRVGSCPGWWCSWL